MLLLLSPSKSLDFTASAPDFVRCTQPQLTAHSAQLIAEARKLSQSDIMQMMHVSEKIADLNLQRFTDWQLPFTPENSKPALYAFTGDVYTGMNVAAWTSQEANLAQAQIRILSGLYGVLRPFDLMQAYRLEMGIALRNERGRNLYAFWKKTITEALNADLAKAQTKTIVNLASEEYFKAVDTKTLNANVINVAFKEERNGVLKIISFSAKRARGSMADFIIRNAITNENDLQAFDKDGYVFNENLSSSNNLVFIR
jgi:uncharacterized protein